MSVEELQRVIVPISLSVVVLFGVWAMYMSWKYSSRKESQDAEFFLTARNSQPIWRVIWGFYATSVGASVLFAPSSLICNPDTGTGVIGMVTYAIYSGLPLILAANLGSSIRKRYPEAVSITSYARWRFGKVYQVFLAILVLFNMSVAMVAEFTAIGDLFAEFLGTSRIVPVVVVGVTTMLYTAIGGLYVSILTDQVQSIFSVLLMAIVFIYVGVTFRPSTFPPLPAYLGPTPLGYASIFSLGASLIPATLFSDAIWQRVWAAENDRALNWGAAGGAFLTTIVVFLFGMAGFIATWSGLSTNPDTAFFAILRPVTEPGSPLADPPLWIMTLVCVIAATVNESAIDSFQNAIADTFVTLFQNRGRPVSLTFIRVFIVLVNIPMMWIGVMGYSIAGLFLITNVLTACAFLPFCLGLIKSFDTWLNGASVTFGTVLAMASVVVHGYIVEGDFVRGLYRDFYYIYDWQQFAVAMVMSLVGVILYSGTELLLDRYLAIPIRGAPDHVLFNLNEDGAEEYVYEQNFPPEYDEEDKDMTTFGNFDGPEMFQDLTYRKSVQV